MQQCRVAVADRAPRRVPVDPRQDTYHLARGERGSGEQLQFGAPDHGRRVEDDEHHRCRSVPHDLHAPDLREFVAQCAYSRPRDTDDPHDTRSGLVESSPPVRIPPAHDVVGTGRHETSRGGFAVSIAASIRSRAAGPAAIPATVRTRCSSR